MVAFDSRIAVFSLLREINQYPQAPLLAIIPDVALRELWDLMSVAEDALRIRDCSAW